MSRKKMTKADAHALIDARGLATREAAIAALVERDVARWGESERDASARMRAGLSHGRALNSLAVYDVDAVDEPLVAAAAALLTADDMAGLRRGG